MGRILLDGATRVRIQGDEIEVKARITLASTIYSGHADAGELVDWVRARGPVRHAVFLTHGEETGLKGLKAGLSGFLPEERRVIPLIDDAFELTGAGHRQIDINVRRRLLPERVARLDWHNDLSRLLLDVSGTVNAAADERGRAAIIRRLRRALDAERRIDGSKPAVKGWIRQVPAIDCRHEAVASGTNMIDAPRCRGARHGE